MAAPSLELKDLVKLPVAAKWKDLGVQLGVPTHKLDEIQADQKNSPHVSQECLRDMFDWWLNNGHDVTKEKLDRALRDIEKTHGEEMHTNQSVVTHMHDCVDVYTSLPPPQLLSHPGNNLYIYNKASEGPC